MNIDVFFDVGLNKLLNTQPSYQWFEMPWGSCEVSLIYIFIPACETIPYKAEPFTVKSFYVRGWPCECCKTCPRIFSSSFDLLHGAVWLDKHSCKMSDIPICMQKK